MNKEIKTSFFTIIIPTYNRKHVVGRAIQSVLNQEFKDWELIIVDDGSTDQTDVFISSHFEDPRISYFYKDHEERSAARNYGIDQAKGKFICFLDSDDEYLPNFLENNFRAIELHPEFKIFRSGTILVKDGKNKMLPYPDPEWTSFESICRNFNGLCSYMIYKELLINEKFDTRFYVGEDFHLISRLVFENRFYQIKKYGFMIQYNNLNELKKSYNLSKMQMKAACFKDLIQKEKLSDISLKLIMERILIVHFIIIYTFLKKMNFVNLKYGVESFFILVKNPILSIKVFIQLKNAHNY